MKQTEPCGKFSESQIVAILGSVSKERNVESVCRGYGISPATFYNWKTKSGETGTEELKRMRELEAENARLKNRTDDAVQQDLDIWWNSYNFDDHILLWAI